MFNWATTTIDGLAWHIAKVSRQQTMAAITYYRRKGNTEVVRRIEFARALAKKYKVLLLAEDIKQELENTNAFTEEE